MKFNLTKPNFTKSNQTKLHKLKIFIVGSSISPSIFLFRQRDQPLCCVKFILREIDQYNMDWGTSNNYAAHFSLL